MAEVPVTIVCMIYPRDKSVKPYPATIQGYAHITGLGIGGGPIIPEVPIDPPVDPPIEPPLGIWPGPGDPDFPGGGPPDLPPVDPPVTVTPPHEGWNWSAAKSGWYFVYVPRPGDAQPKKR